VDAEPVTVVVATRNRCARLRHTLHELLALPERPAIVVVDNGSDDNTATMVRLRFPSVELLALPANRGAVARNLGVRRARTRFVAFADDDSGWAPGALATAAGHLRRHPRLAVVAARTLVGAQHRLDPVSTVMARSPLGRDPDLPGPSVLGFLACAAVVRREAFLRAGGFDPVVFFMGEEARLAYDLARLGWGLAYCDDVVALHDPDRPPDPARAALADRNRVLTAWMRRPVRVAAAQTVGLLAGAARGGPARRAAVQLAGRLPAALARRVAPAPAVEARLRLLEDTSEAAPATAWSLVPGR
jgi:GT2 family glycosyltransferase